MGCVFEILRTLPCIFIMYMHVYPCIMYVLIQVLVLQYPIFNRFVINKLIVFEYNKPCGGEI